MATLALAMLIAFGVSFVARVAIQLSRTGETGLIGIDWDAGPLVLLSGIAFIAGMAMGVASPPLAVSDVIEPIAAIESPPLQVLGAVLAGAGIVLVFAAQLGMGESWRVGVSDEQGTELVTGGLFALCRNPIYTAMIAAWAGFALMVPTVLGLAAVPAIVLALELQVRLVEEPFMVRAHGTAYAAYAGRVGRFLPGIGRGRPVA